KIEPLSRTELGGYVPPSQTLALVEEFLSRRHVLTYRRGHAMAYLLARSLAKRLNFTGDPHLVDRYPMAFLARVYATFHQSLEGGEPDESTDEMDGRRPQVAGEVRNKRHFVEKRAGAWRRFEQLLDRLDTVSLRRFSAAETAEFSRLFREL